MNDELDYRRRLRELGGPVQPARDLWLDIAPRLQAQAPARAVVPPRRRRSVALAIAASVLLAAGGLWLARPSRAPQVDATAAAGAEAGPALARADAALKALPPVRDPRLVGALIELDHASRELQQSLQRQPDAVFLVGLLNRTYERRMKLARLGQAST